MHSEYYIGKNVVIGKDCKIARNVVIHDDTVIGDRVIIHDGTILGRAPMKAKRSATTSSEALPGLVVGSDVSIGSNVILYRGARIGNSVLLADSSQVREKSSVGDETIIGRNVTVENGSSVGARCKVETNAYITAFSIVEDYCFIAPMVCFTNDPYLSRSKGKSGHIKGPHLKRGARIGANATILPGLVLHEDCLVAAGSIVTKDVRAGMLVMGCPAREVRPVNPEQLLSNQLS